MTVFVVVVVIHANIYECQLKECVLQLICKCQRKPKE